MTAEELNACVREVVALIVKTAEKDVGQAPTGFGAAMIGEGNVRWLIQEAVAAELEACARIAATLQDDGKELLRQVDAEHVEAGAAIAAAIRARSRADRRAGERDRPDPTFTEVFRR